MGPIRGLLVLVVAAILPLAAAAFESAPLDAGARDLLIHLRQQHAVEPAGPVIALARAGALAGAGQWEEAVEQYGRAVIAAPADSPAALVAPAPDSLRMTRAASSMCRMEPSVSLME